MNLTKLIEATGRRVRLGKRSAAKLTNAEVKEVLETAIEILKEALIQEGRVEIQHFAVIEIKRKQVKPSSNRVSTPRDDPAVYAERTYWRFHPSTSLKSQQKSISILKSKI
jgi:nucleoid DNA-binding protein